MVEARVALARHDVLKRIAGGENFAFPDETLAVAEIQAQHKFSGVGAVEWAQEKGLVTNGSVVLVETSPTFLCSEACLHCRDSSIEHAKRVKMGLEPAVEEKAAPELMMERMDYVTDLAGGRIHNMFIGGTIDSEEHLPDYINHALQHGPVSQFTDGILYIDEKTGQPSNLMRRNLEQGWLQLVATHVSMDFPYGYNYPKGRIGLMDRVTPLPRKAGRVLTFKIDPTYSRLFKSYYGAVAAKRLIEHDVRRVVINMTIYKDNAQFVLPIYEQVKQLAEYATRIESPTEVYMTISPVIGRSHHARGDSPSGNPQETWLQYENMFDLNHAFSFILQDTYDRTGQGLPRIIANSSGYIGLFATSDPEFHRIVVEQDVDYPGGRPMILQINPNADVWADAMFPGPELKIIRHTFGYVDREPRRERNRFTEFHDDGYGEWFPNIVPS